MKLLSLLILIMASTAIAQRTGTFDADCLRVTTSGVCIDKDEFESLNDIDSNIQAQIDSLSGGTSDLEDDVADHESRLDVIEADNATHTELDAHTSDTTTHGTTGDIVGTTDTQTLTNKTIDADSSTISNIDTTELKSGVLDTDISSVAGTDTTIPSAKAVKDYVDANANAATVQTNLDNHIGDTTDAHDASAISSVASGNLSATDAQSALNELQTDIDSRTTGEASSVDSEVALFSSTTGKDLKRATGTGFAKLTSGVLSTSSTVNAASELSNQVPLANGGSNKNMTAVNGGVVWTDSDSMEVIAAGTSGQILKSNGAAAPSWITSSTSDKFCSFQFGAATNYRDSCTSSPCTIYEHINACASSVSRTAQGFYEVNWNSSYWNSTNYHCICTVTNWATGATGPIVYHSAAQTNTKLSIRLSATTDGAIDCHCHGSSP
jgi:hypothetical protein